MIRLLNAYLILVGLSLALSVGCSAGSPEPTSDGEVVAEQQGQSEGDTSPTLDASGAEQNTAQDVPSTSGDVAEAGPHDALDVASTDASEGDACTSASLDVEGTDGTGEAGEVCGPEAFAGPAEGDWEACKPGLVCCIGCAQCPARCMAPCCGPTCEAGCEIGPFS
jgi:hypothetical protein